MNNRDIIRYKLNEGEVNKMVIIHNREIKIDEDALHDALEDMIENAIYYNVKAFKLCSEDKHNEASVYADLRDAYLGDYKKITGIFIDYGDLPKE